MKKKRIIPVLLLRNGQLVQSKLFKEYKNLGNPLKAVERFSQWDADELIYLDISKGTSNTFLRTDLKVGGNFKLDELIVEVAKSASMPITFGGGIRSLADAELRFRLGADKISVNKLLIENHRVVQQIASKFGTQAIVGSVDCSVLDGRYVLYNNGSADPELDLFEHIARLEEYGVGELLLNVVDRDGMKTGFDIDLYKVVTRELSLPVIGMGGAGDWSDFAVALKDSGLDAVAAANVFQHFDQSVYLARKSAYEAGIPVRRPTLM